MLLALLQVERERRHYFFTLLPPRSGAHCSPPMDELLLWLCRRCCSLKFHFFIFAPFIPCNHQCVRTEMNTLHVSMSFTPGHKLPTSKNRNCAVLHLLPNCCAFIKLLPQKSKPQVGSRNLCAWAWRVTVKGGYIYFTVVQLHNGIQRGKFAALLRRHWLTAEKCNFRRNRSFMTRSYTKQKVRKSQNCVG